MSILFGSNIASLGAQRSLARSSSALQTIFERLSSGQRINRASDDAAGLAIASSLRTDSRVFSQALRNVNDGLSLLNIQDGALESLTGVLMRQRELAAQAANGSFSLEQRLSLQEEFHALSFEYNRILSTTEFNGIGLFGDLGSSMRIQAGYGTQGSVSFDMGSELARDVGDGTFGAFDGYLGYGAFGTFGDFNNDGIQDYFGMEDESGYGSQVMIGDGSGGFTNIGSVFTASDSDVAVGAADLNGDGNLDLFAINQGASSVSAAHIRYAFGNGDGTFQSVQSTSLVPLVGSTTGFLDFGIGDANGDGIVDIFLQTVDGLFNIYGGDTLAANDSPLTSASNATDISVSDFNGDGLADYLTRVGSDTVLFLNQGGGSFAASATLTGVVSTAQDVADVDQDGYLDIILKDQAGDIHVLLGDGDGSFADHLTFAGNGVGTRSLKLADLNSDGFLDLVEVNSSGELGTYLGNGDGTFEDRVTSSGSFATPTHIFLEDIDGDGVVELINPFLAGATYSANTELSANAGYYSLATQEEALSALDQVEEALTRLSSERGVIGAIQSRLGSAANILFATRENYQAAESRIVDADISFEAADLVRQGILQQAASAVLAQANQQPALALQLLRGER
ncbi:MAG: VCBS repeat-containing protein [Bdellovibrionales bacterium]|nr:VCBS repeat-containing protein [Bdellovibrionales bacterium]